MVFLFVGASSITRYCVGSDHIERPISWHDVSRCMIGNYFGLHVVSYTMGSYMLSSMQGTVYEEQWYATAWWTGVGATLVMALQMGLLWIVQEPIIMTTYIWNHGIPSIGIDALVGVVVHKLVWRWEEKDEYMW